MRIPPSVFVMSVLTAVPFGLGIRDTLAHRDAGDQDEYDDGFDFGGKRRARERRRELEEYEAETRREAAEREARNARRVAQLDQLFGPRPATMGALLAGIDLGANAGSFQPEHVRQRIERVAREGLISVAFDADAQALNGVDVFVTTDYETSDACDTLEDKLHAAWGPATRGVWVDPSTHQRAAFDDDECHLRFDRYLEPTDWVGKLPLQRIGTHVDKLTTELGGLVDDADEEGVWWHMPGLRFGKAATKLEAYVAGGKVVGFRATVDSDFDSMIAVRDALAATLKAQPKRDEDTGFWTWSKRPKVMIDTSETDRFTVLVGQTPWD